ncbi:unnamed protein product [Ceutorhynchus assimilis]|uniref:Pro-resilin n=1 Tax=Ceutorhynchus assimilis TaxID=467358 RepID=A0A9N9MBQ0_9CUCU|nr:unnamed protein product [Ceutorhynchus assimilis]
MSKTKISTIIIATLSLALAEPPVPSNQYLPANQYQTPQNQYLPPQNQYLPPQNQYQSPKNQYLPPQNQYLPPVVTTSAPRYLPPSTLYGTPQTQAVIRPSASKTYLPPSTSYGTPSASRVPSRTYGTPSSSYGTPSRSYGTPSASYGAPSSSYGAPSSSYGVPTGGYGRGGYEEPSEPANYEFEYQVQDAASGNDFGHREQRQGDVAQGKYFVLLPDGRLQTVEYTADASGYKPRISYQQVGISGGYPSGPSGSGGYQY